MRRAALALLLASGTAAAQDMGDALRLGDLICEFGGDGGRSLVGELAGAPGASELLLVYEQVTPRSAQVLSSRTPGRRAVQVRATGRAVHFIEPLGPSVRVTTLTGCEQRALRGGAVRCVRYAARHAWHFDARALADPDAAFAELPTGTAAGRCEPWRVE